MNIFITGCAGFIGSAVAKKLLQKNHKVVGVDNFNDYYDPKLKRDRARIFLKNSLEIILADIIDKKKLHSLFEKNSFDVICHLAAQAGVRYSLTDPYVYEKTNILGTLTLFELAREFKIPKIVYASSSSVYGASPTIPFSENDPVQYPLSLYAATKRSCELIAYTYHHLYGFKCVGLRYFTVYGPWGRPDMALFKFVKSILHEKSIDVYNYGDMERDFTYIDDIVDGTVRALEKSFEYEIFNLGNNMPIKLDYFIEIIEKQLGKKAKKKLLTLQPGDIIKTYADITKAKKFLGWKPKMPIEEGVMRFIEWYKEYYNISHVS